MVVRTARVGVRLTPAQRRRCFRLLVAAGDVWACVLDMNRWRRQRGLVAITDFQQLCRELHQAGPGAFGELNSTCAEGVLRRYSDAWFAAAKRRTGGDASAGFPRRKRRLMPVRFRHGCFAIDGRRLRLAVARGRPPLWVRLDRDLPYPAERVRSVTLLNEGSRLFVEVTAEVPVATHPPGHEPDPERVAGVDLGVIHPFAVAGPGGEGLLVSGRALRAEAHLHLKDAKYRRRAVARRAPKPGQAGSRRWRKYRARQRKLEARHKRRIKQAQHEAAKQVIEWAAQRRIGTLQVGDPRGVLELKAGRRHNQRVRDWRPGYLIRCLKDKAEQAGIRLELVDERGSSSTCPVCGRRVPKPTGRRFRCMHCGFSGHRDLVGGANIAHRTMGGPITTTKKNPFPVVITHRRAGRHLPGARPARRDPRRRPHHGTAKGSPGRPRPAPPLVGSRSPQARINQHGHSTTNVD
ncbi:RNA-guided endonuclease InsQ/TnpB family protein [Actinoallomurus rhizosphaericola]|uniref:RNA-guided endonuclease InsQ/TnpB family protein n=1 Tax=Actinoallomurus rhizosphaericola TaxID=2952536 RepID=UPI002090836C|nr:transposase [Actinoallomurus rhizosphaericola]MCO5994241.1 transposase [Actinoallomurus rhizosphaericola]